MENNEAGKMRTEGGAANCHHNTAWTPDKSNYGVERGSNGTVSTRRTGGYTQKVEYGKTGIEEREIGRDHSATWIPDKNGGRIGRVGAETASAKWVGVDCGLSVNGGLDGRVEEPRRMWAMEGEPRYQQRQGGRQGRM